MISTIFFKIFSWIALGFALRCALIHYRSELDSKRAFYWVRQIILFVSLPTTMFLALHSLHFDLGVLFPVSMAWIIFAVGFFVFTRVGARKQFSSSTVGALIMTGGFGNTSFVGYPLLVAIYGDASLQTAVLTDQPGSFLALSTVGVLAATYFSALSFSQENSTENDPESGPENGKAAATRTPSARVLFQRIVRFPPIWGLLIAVLLRSVEFPHFAFETLSLLSSTLIPLALISVGSELMIDLKQLEGRKTALALGLGYKLLFAPFLMLLIYYALTLMHGPVSDLAPGVTSDVARITILEAAMAPMITGAIIARENDLDPELCSLMVSFGIPLSLITVPILAKLLDKLGV
jgi:predicted permease